MTTYTGRDFWESAGCRWPTAPLRRIATLGTGHTPSRSQPEYWEDCTIPWVTTEDLTKRVDSDLAPLMDTRQKISELGLANSAAVLHPTDTVMLSRTASVGHVARIGKPMATTQAFVTWACGDSIDPRFLVLALKAMTPEILRIAYGSTHLTIYMPDIEQLRVPVPPLRVQRQVADYLESETGRIDATIATKRRLSALVRERTEARVTSLFDAQLGDAVRLSYLVTSLTQGSSPQAGGRPAEAGEWGLLKLSAVKNGSFQPGANKVLSPGEVTLPLHPRRGDLLVTRANTPAYVGDSCAVTEDYPELVICDLIYRLRLSPSLDAEFASLCLQRPETRSELAGLARGTSQSMVKLRGEDIRSVRIPVPDVGVQHALVRQARAIRQRGEEIQAHLKTQIKLLREHRQALITAAVTGELEIPGVA